VRGLPPSRPPYVVEVSAALAEDQDRLQREHAHEAVHR